MLQAGFAGNGRARETQRLREAQHGLVLGQDFAAHATHAPAPCPLHDPAQHPRAEAEPRERIADEDREVGRVALDARARNSADERLAGGRGSAATSANSCEGSASPGAGLLLAELAH